MGLLGSGGLWLNGTSDDECPCNSVHCCALNETCPNHSPCLCVSVEYKSTNDSCVPTEGMDQDVEVGIVSLIVIGAGLLFAVALLLMWWIIVILLW